MKMARFIIVGILFMAMAFSGCEKINLFEKNHSFKKHEWPGNEKPTVQFDITDTTGLYNLFVVVRHTDAYNFNNLWINIYTKAPGDTSFSKQQLDLQLANNEKGWLGSGMDDVFEHRIRITQAPIPLKYGQYQFAFEQIMREDPLQNILNVGLRVERVDK